MTDESEYVTDEFGHVLSPAYVASKLLEEHVHGLLTEAETLGQAFDRYDQWILAANEESAATDYKAVQDALREALFRALCDYMRPAVLADLMDEREPS